MAEGAAPFAGRFGALDWAVVALVLVVTTWVGERMAGRQRSVRDFFLGGRKLPWYAVAASIIATEISAVTYISLPSVVYRPGGDWTYLQIGLIGSLLARLGVGYLLVPRYFEREIYSPYDYMGERLGGATRSLATALFSLGGVLGQSARVYLTAVVLEVVLARELAAFETATGIPPLVSAVGAIGLVALAWTWMGGIATVVWTDGILFLLFLAGIAIALATVSAGLEGGLGQALADARAAGKLRVFDTSLDPTRPYTLLAATVAASWGGIGFYGTDQLLAQRLFCCRDAREARRAIVASYAAMGVTVLAALVGAALWAFYRAHPLTGAAAELVADQPDRIFPLFVIERIPSPLKGVVLAGAFAAAISSLDSILAALSQTSFSALVEPHLRPAADPAAGARRAVRVSRGLVVVWGVFLCAAAIGIDVVARSYASILDLALAMASYTGGALVAGFFLALLPLRRDGSGLVFSAPLSVLCVFAVTSHQSWGRTLPLSPVLLCDAAAVVLFVLWLACRTLPERRALGTAHAAARLLLIVLGLALLVWLAREGYLEGPSGPAGAPTRRVIAWPWYIPLGSTVAFLWGWALGRPRAGAAPRLQRRRVGGR